MFVYPCCLLSIKLRLQVVMSINLEYRERERQRPAKLNEKKSDRDLEREI